MDLKGELDILWMFCCLLETNKSPQLSGKSSRGTHVRDFNLNGRSATNCPICERTKLIRWHFDEENQTTILDTDLSGSGEANVCTGNVTKWENAFSPHAHMDNRSCGKIHA